MKYDEIARALQDKATAVLAASSNSNALQIIGELQEQLFQYSPQKINKRENKSKSGFYDRILKDLLSSVRSAISREQFLDILLTGLGERDQERASDFVLLIEGFKASSNETLTSASIKKIVGGNNSRQLNAKSAFKDRSMNSPIARALLEQSKTVDFLLTHLAEPTEYRDDFLELHGKDPKWICGVPMPSSKVGEPERALVAIFDATLDGSSIYYPRQALQEWFLLELVPDVYSMLEHQILTVDEQLETERKQLIMELAPTAINHEIGTAIGLIQRFRHATSSVSCNVR